MTTRRAAGTDPAEPAGAESVSKPAIGRSRGGLTTKVHALTDGRGRALVLLLSAGNINDTSMFAPLLAALRVARTHAGRPRTTPAYLVADKGYSSRANRALLRRRGIAHTIPERRDQQANRRRKSAAGGCPVGVDADPYARRNVVEAASARSSSGPDWPPATTRRPINFAGALSLAPLLAWLP